MPAHREERLAAPARPDGAGELDAIGMAIPVLVLVGAARVVSTVEDVDAFFKAVFSGG